MASAGARSSTRSRATSHSSGPMSGSDRPAGWPEAESRLITIRSDGPAGRAGRARPQGPSPGWPAPPPTGRRPAARLRRGDANEGQVQTVRDTLRGRDPTRSPVKAPGPVPTMTPDRLDRSTPADSSNRSIPEAAFRHDDIRHPKAPSATTPADGPASAMITWGSSRYPSPGAARYVCCPGRGQRTSVTVTRWPRHRPGSVRPARPHRSRGSSPVPSIWTSRRSAGSAPANRSGHSTSVRRPTAGSSISLPARASAASARR